MSANNCSEEYLQTVNIVWAGMFLLSFLACLAVMVLWIRCACRDPHKERWCDYTSLFYTAERLPFYVLIIAMANSLCSLAQLITLVHEETDTFMNLCISAAFFATLTDTGILLISIITPVHLFLMTWKRSSDWLQDKKKRRPPGLEILYCIIVIGGSLLFAAIPLFCLLGGVQCYGYDPVGQWCWISSKDENCSRIAAGFGMEMGLFFAPTIVALVLSVGAFFYVITPRCKKEDCLPPILKLRANWKNPDKPTCPMIILTCYLFCFSIINVISLIIRIRGLLDKEDTIFLTTIYSLWGVIPAFFVFILLVYEFRFKNKRNDGSEDGEQYPLQQT